MFKLGDHHQAILMCSQAVLIIHPFLFCFSTGGKATLSEITEFIKQTKISRVKLPESELQDVLRILELDFKVEPVPGQQQPAPLSQSPGQRLTGQKRKADEISSGEDIGSVTYRLYKLSEASLNPSGVTQIPCAQCPVAKQCEPGGTVVSPETCPYLSKWLGAGPPQKVHAVSLFDW